jgi:uncharacterized membrane protein YgdD (TMEM256/DUF423 family)
MNRTIVLTGLLLILSGIILGAFGAHAIKNLVSAEKLISFEVGVRYQFYHGLSFLVVGLLSDKFRFELKWFFRLCLIGILCFSLSIYGLTFSEFAGFLKFLGPVTPIGGLLMISAWLILIFRLFNDRQI